MTCPNCGSEYQGDRCPNCGRPASSSGGRIAAVVILIFLVIPAALFGACSIYAVVGSSGGSSYEANSWRSIFGLMAAVGIAVFIGGLALVVKLWRK